MLTFSFIIQILQADFGLTTFVSHQTITERISALFPNNPGLFRPVRTTVSYLTLPGNAFMDGLSDHDDFDDLSEIDGFQGDSTFFDAIDPSSLQITEQQKKRFHKVMTVFGLKPFVRGCQLPSVDRLRGDLVQRPLRRKTVEEDRAVRTEAAKTIAGRSWAESLGVEHY